MKLEKAMKERYWEPTPPPAAVLEWVSKNVALAMRKAWKHEPPIIYVDDKHFRLVIEVLGPEIPGAEANPYYSVKRDLFAALKEYAYPYGPRGPSKDETAWAQRQDCADRAAMLRQLAERVLKLAEKVEDHSKP